MKRLVVSVPVLLLFAWLATVPAYAQNTAPEVSRSLHQAIVEGDIDQVQSLLSKGADVNLKNRMSWTPLHTAARNHQKAIVELLISKGADVNAKNKANQTPLHFAVDRGQKDVIELLIAKGADVNAVGGRGDNALSLAKKNGNKEITDLLLKHGAKEPVVNLAEDRMYDLEGGPQGPGAQPNYQTGLQRGPRAIRQSPVQVDILADPNEIIARVKTFQDLEKNVAEAADKSKIEMRHWELNKYDNRTSLVRAVQQQFEDEMTLVRKVAVEEKAKKTTAAIDSLLTKRQERAKRVNRELLLQKKELKETQVDSQSTRARGRGRTSGRNTRGRYPQRGEQYGADTTDPLYGRGVASGTNRPDGPARPAEQLDRETEDEIRQWLQATDDKADLAKAIHQQIRTEITSVRTVAVEEKAKKTTAAIDGLLLARQIRLDAFAKKMEDAKRALQQTQDPRAPGMYNDPRQGGRYGGQTYRGGTGTQGGRTQQDPRSRDRTRRR
jgi:hypothetical protein